MSESENYYEELGVEPGASRDELREAHRQRVADLEAARDKKGVSEAQLQANRDEVARCGRRGTCSPTRSNASATTRELGSDAEPEPGSDVELVDDDVDATQGSGAELTGWRKLLAPPPPKNAGGGNGNGKTPARRTDRNGRPRPEPTVVLPAGMTITEPRVRGMALLFDISILIVIFFAVSLVVPRLIQSDYQDVQDRISKTTDLKDARQSVIDARRRARQDAVTKAQSVAQKDYRSAVKDAKDADVPARFLNPADPPTTKQLQTYADNQADDIKTTGYVTTGLTFVLALAYLVPITALKGRTLGMRGRKIRVVRIDGAPPGWYASFTRYALPILLALAIPSFGVILGLGMVAWGYFDRNGQGIHDKLAAPSWSTRSLEISARAPRQQERAMSYVYAFEEGSKEQKFLLGGKGANLAEMTRLGLPVPPGFTISTDACRAYMAADDTIPAGLMDEVAAALSALETKMGKQLGDATDPLLVSVRSGAAFSMPGMMDTVLNLGLNDVSVGGLAKQTDNPRFAYDSYRRFVQMFAKIVLDVDGAKFEHALEQLREERGVATDPELSADDLEGLADRFKAIVLAEAGIEFPQDPHRAAAARHRGRVPLVEQRARLHLPAHGEDRRRPRHRGQRPVDGVRQQG